MVFLHIGATKVDNKVPFGVHVNICTNELWNLQKSWSQGSIFLGFHGNSSALIEHSQQRVDIQWICSLFKQANPQNYVPINLTKFFNSMYLINQEFNYFTKHVILLFCKMHSMKEKGQFENYQNLVHVKMFPCVLE